ncbi:hypothetical protein T4B_8328 [Trichinella pseudospiralis]|uniref:Uncharacterized protein n=1 Tax=Trichinella pseudospiralis TaxID=6337 RepID=A0A0V1IZ84_TRIPS|nr:hypothetical protein T4B_8328 [Trichinella pseudospiralis]
MKYIGSVTFSNGWFRYQLVQLKPKLSFNKAAAAATTTTTTTNTTTTLLLLLLLLLLNTATAVADRSTPGHKSSATIWCPAVISKAGGDVVNAIEHSNNNGGQTAKLISSQFRKQSQLRPHPLLDTGQPWRPPEASTSRNRHASMINYNSTFFHFSSVQATAVQLDIEE